LRRAGNADCDVVLGALEVAELDELFAGDDEVAIETALSRQRDRPRIESCVVPVIEVCGFGYRLRGGSDIAVQLPAKSCRGRAPGRVTAAAVTKVVATERFPP
jgi:hypothetical protein